MADYTYEYFDQPSAPPVNGHAASQPRSEVLNFQPNVPVQLSIKFAKAKIIDTKRGQRAMYTLQDKRVMFLPRDIAGRIEILKIRPGELFWIVCRPPAERGGLEEWDVYLDPATERARTQRSAPPPPPNSTTPVANQPAAEGATLSGSQDSAEKAGAEQQAPDGVKKACADGSASQIHFGWAQHLISVTDTLTDVYAAALAHAQKHGGSVRNEDVRTFVITAFIQQCDRKGPSHA